MTTEKAAFGAGCCWGVEAAFRQGEGVAATAVGFMGGSLDHPSYRDVCTDQTGHAEVVDIEFDPARVKYEDLLAVFWEVHDPTQSNRQGPDVGTQYRSVIFFHSPAQAAAAQDSTKNLEGGILEEEEEGWDSTGRHVAQSRQLAVVVGK